jgi:hypothetical protein
MSACPSAGQLTRLLNEQLSAEEFPAVVAHVERCSGCQATLQGLCNDGDMVRWRQLHGQPRPPLLPADFRFTKPAD